MFIALDTSGDWCSVAIGATSDLAASARINFAAEKLGQGHSRRVIAMLDELMGQGQHQIEDIQAIVFANGPGSFTGLRIACGVAQGLAFGQNKPLVEISTLEVLAQRFATNRPISALDAATLVLFDARMGELYGQVFSAQLDAMTDPFVVKPEAIGEQLSRLNIDQFYAVGNAWGLDLPELKLLAQRAIEVDASAFPRADWLLALGERYFAIGKTTSAARAAPLYVRDNVALDSHEQRLLREKNQLARQSESIAP
jgi:tRNA threonylcarbamoyladenosine biosynthesis protein TsaB